MPQPYLLYRLTSDALCLGERIKKGTYRTTVRTVPYSQITGALRAHYAGDLHAAGFFTRPDPYDPEALAGHLKTVTFALTDTVRGVAKVPIDTQVLVDVEAKIFVPGTEEANTLPQTIVLALGAYRNKGLGACTLSFTQRIDHYQTRIGELATRIPESCLHLFGISKVHRPLYGYLFQPDEQRESGAYVRSIFEGSLVTGPEFLLKS